MKTTRKHIDLQERIVFRTILFLIVSTILLLLPASVFAQEEEDTPSPASAVQDAGPLADPGEGTTLQSPASEAAVKASDSTEANGEDKPEMDDTAQTEVSNAAESSVSSPGPPDPDALSHYRFPKQPKLRPCCAFGHTLRTTVSGTAVPVKLDNILYPHRLGLHSYENKGLQQEMNGLIYTCRGGVIDLAHIRDYADWTAYLYERILQALPRGAVIQLPNEAATRSLVIRRPVLSLDDAETQELALLLARRIAFQLSVWHEIVTWYDHRSVELFSERLSSFSPEDLFSNALGTQIGAEALRSGKPYNEAVDEALTQAVQSLAPLYNKQTKRTLNMVDGVWWDRSKTMPDMTMVMRRNLDVGDTIVPWVLPDAFSPYCKGRGEEPARIAIPVVGPGELNLTDLYELRFVVDTEEVPKFIVPDKENGWIGEEDFPELIGTIRIEVKNLFGPLGDSPTISLEEGTGLSSKAGEFDPEHPCGLADKDCSLTRNEEVHGIHIGKVRVAGGSFPGMVFGATLAEGATIGGLFNVLTMNTAVDFTDGSFTLHAKAIESPVLFFCSVEAEDGSGRTEVDYPFVNPFEVKCVPGAYWGLKLDLLEMIYSNSFDSFGFRPVEAGVVLNALGNGFQPQFLRRHLLLSLGLSPEILLVNHGDSLQRNRPFMAYFSMIYDHVFWDDRLTWKSFGSLRDDLTEVRRFNVDGGMKFQYNQLWSRRDFRGGDPLQSIVSFGIEVALAYWYEKRSSIPSMIASAPVMVTNDYIPDNWGVSGLALFYIETTIPKLGMF